MSRKTEFIIFSAALLLFVLMVAGGIAYFKKPLNQSDSGGDLPITVDSQEVATIPADMVVAPSTPSSTYTPLTLPYVLTASTANSRFWPKAWGNVAFSNNNLYLIPDPSTHGANSFLNGASSWGNYSITTNVLGLTSGWFDIVARVSNNGKNFVYCEFGPNGTEIIDRMNGADSQIASSVVSSTNPSGVSESFGMEVYGNQIACTIAGQEIVGVSAVYSNESQKGGIGFVVFGQPKGQQRIELSDLSVSALNQNTIISPFPVAVTVSSNGTSETAATSTTIIASSSIEKSLPYSIGTFNNSFVAGDGWSDLTGSVVEKDGLLTVAANASTTSGGSLLQESSAWKDYTFQATINWSKGETFGLIARYIDNQDYLVCEYDEKNIGDVNIKLDQHLNGIVTHLAQGDVLNYDEKGGANIIAAIQVDGNKGTCAFNSHIVSTIFASDTISPKLSNGEIGFATWDPIVNDSQITIKNIGVTAEIYSLGKPTTKN